MKRFFDDKILKLNNDVIGLEMIKILMRHEIFNFRNTDYLKRINEELDKEFDQTEVT